MFPYCSVHKDTCISPDGKPHNPVDHILIYTRRHLSVLDVRSCRAAACGTAHCLVVTIVREILAVNKQGHRLHTERLNLKKLSIVLRC
jgi:hypothetical protein